MADTIVSALIAASVTLVTAYATQFLAEQYRRFKDGSALAAGLAGELSSYSTAYPLLEPPLSAWANGGDRGPAKVFFRPFERPRDAFFDEVVGKLGGLGYEMVDPIVFVYGNLRAFRIGLEVLSKSHAEMTDVEFQLRCKSCGFCLTQAHDAATALVPKLKKRAQESFWRGGHWLK